MRAPSRLRAKFWVAEAYGRKVRRFAFEDGLSGVAAKASSATLLLPQEGLDQHASVSKVLSETLQSSLLPSLRIFPHNPSVLAHFRRRSRHSIRHDPS
jgi:hypothetical protein